jgi:hypothetical protein
MKRPATASGRAVTAALLAIGMAVLSCGRSAGSGTDGAQDGSGRGGDAGSGAGTAGTSGAAGSPGGAIGTGGAAGTGVAGTAGGPGTGGLGLGGNVASDPDLVLLYRFDEQSGTTAADTSGFPGGPRNGTLMTVGMGTATFSTDHQVGTHALQLGGGTISDGGFVVIPSLQMLAPEAATLVAWIKMTSPIATTLGSDLFSFSVDSSNYMSFLVNPRRATTSFQILTGGLPLQKVQSDAAISTDTWHHMAVVLQAGSPYTATLYIDGAVAARNDTMMFHASDLGATPANYIGRAVFTSTMSYLAGFIDDFRVYRRALTAAEITALFSLR